MFYQEIYNHFLSTTTQATMNSDTNQVQLDTESVI